MWNRKEIKATGKAAFRANYWKCVLAGFLLTVLAAGSAGSSSNQAAQETAQQTDGTILSINGNPIENLPPAVLGAIAVGILGIIALAILMRIFFFNPLKIGCHAFYNNNVIQPGASLDTIGDGFKDYGRTFVTLFLTDLYIVLWCLLFIIPGIIKAYSYQMVPYILRDDPELPANEVIAKSAQMMKGHKWNAFILDLSFLGWDILDILTLGVLGVFWVHPYKFSSDAALYLAIREENERKFH